MPEVKEKAKAYQRPQDAERNREDLPRGLHRKCGNHALIVDIWPPGPGENELLLSLLVELLLFQF